MASTKALPNIPIDGEKVIEYRKAMVPEKLPKTMVVIGAGAIGGLAGGYMTKAGHDVLLVDRWKEHVDALNDKGMIIDGVRGDLTIPVKAATPDQLSGDLGVVLIATKSQHTLEALQQIVPLLTSSIS